MSTTKKHQHPNTLNLQIKPIRDLDHQLNPQGLHKKIPEQSPAQSPPLKPRNEGSILNDFKGKECL